MALIPVLLVGAVTAILVAFKLGGPTAVQVTLWVIVLVILVSAAFAVTSVITRTVRNASDGPSKEIVPWDATTITLHAAARKPDDARFKFHFDDGWNRLRTICSQNNIWMLGTANSIKHRNLYVNTYGFTTVGKPGLFHTLQKIARKP